MTPPRMPCLFPLSISPNEEQQFELNLFRPAVTGWVMGTTILTAVRGESPPPQPPPRRMPLLITVAAASAAANRSPLPPPPLRPLQVLLGTTTWREVYPMDFYARGSGSWTNYYAPGGASAGGGARARMRAKAAAAAAAGGGTPAAGAAAEAPAVAAATPAPPVASVESGAS